MLKFSGFTRYDEYFAYKGAIKTRVEIPELGWVDLYNSHLGAVTFDSEKGEYDSAQEHRKLEQARELAHFISTTRTERVQILASDLNSHYKKFEANHFTDDWSEVFSEITHAIPGMELIDTLHAIQGYPSTPDCTYCMDNDYAAKGLFGNAPSEVEDYIFISPDAQVAPEESSIVLKQGFGQSLGPKYVSDHYGVLTRFRVGD